MKITFPIILFVAISLLTGCNNRNPLNYERPKSAEELKAELIRQEQDAPLSYLRDNHVKMTPKEKKIRNGGFFRSAEYAPDGAIIEGDIINSATLAKFKDVVVRISFYSGTKTLIREESYVIYEYVEPNSVKHFSFKIPEIPPAQRAFSCVITSATPVY